MSSVRRGSGNPAGADGDADVVAQEPSTGFEAIDQLLGGVRTGDNVVWQLRGASREPFAAAFLRSSAALPKLAYVSFDASAAQVLARYGNDWLPERSVLLDCSSGRQRGALPDKRLLDKRRLSVRTVEDPRDVFAVTAALAEIEHEFGIGTRYVFDSLTTVQKALGREAALSLFLEHCPRLYDLQTVAYWFLDADEHDQSFLGRVAQLTQVVLDVERSGDDLLVKVVKAQGRTSPSGRRARISLRDGTGRIEADDAGERGHSGEALRRLRTDKGLSQAHLARAVGITPSALSQAERGVSALSVETLARLRRALGIDSEEQRAVPSAYRVWRRGERRRQRLAMGLEGEVVIEDDSGLRIQLLDFAAGTSGKRLPFATKWPELLLVSSGVLEVHVNEATEVLHAGDALLLKDESVTSWRNPGSSTTRVLWMVMGRPN